MSTANFMKSAREKNVDPWLNPTEKPFIQFQSVSKEFGSVSAVRNVSLDIYKGEFFSLLGESGCGKTTMLRLLAGFEKPSSGHIYIDDIDVTKTEPYDLPVNIMFQFYALFPHMSVRDNVAFGLRQARLGRKFIKERVEEMLDLVNMSDFADRRPYQLSGGQRQRVALARALARQPKVLLLDEPLAALDKNLREKTQFELVNIQEKVETTFIMVTHDQEEAMTMSTRIGIMDKGKIKQVGTPGEVYEYPNSLFVAKFIGIVNIFDGIVTSEEQEYVVVKSPHIETDLAVAYSSAAPVGAHVSVVIRPEKILISTEIKNLPNNFAIGIVKDIAYLGDVSLYYVQLRSGKIVIATQPNLFRLAERPVTWDDKVVLYWQTENSIILTI
ncbi:ABC transporter ATP-binding protein [Candidatus Hydrogenosomobacter endosymbioticus]